MEGRDVNGRSIDLLHLAIYLLGACGFSPQEAITNGPRLADVLDKDDIKSLLRSAWSPASTIDKSNDNPKLQSLNHNPTRGITSK